MKFLPAIVLGIGLTTASVAFGLTALWDALPESLTGEPPRAETKTVLIHLRNREADAVRRMLGWLNSGQGHVGVNEAKRVVRITDRPWIVDRLRRVVHEVDQSDAPDLEIRSYRLDDMSTEETAKILTRMTVGRSSGDVVVKVLPARGEQVLIVVANHDGHERIEWLLHWLRHGS